MIDVFYILGTPSDNGYYGTPDTSMSSMKSLALPMNLLQDYLDAKGFVIVEVSDGVVTSLATNTDAYVAYQNSIAMQKTAAQLREEAYDVDAIVDWHDEYITVTKAALLWQYYAAEGNDVITAELTAKIAEAKASIRDRYPGGVTE